MNPANISPCQSTEMMKAYLNLRTSHSNAFTPLRTSAHAPSNRKNALVLSSSFLLSSNPNNSLSTLLLCSENRERSKMWNLGSREHSSWKPSRQMEWRESKSCVAACWGAKSRETEWRVLSFLGSRMDEVVEGRFVWSLVSWALREDAMTVYLGMYQSAVIFTSMSQFRMLSSSFSPIVVDWRGVWHLSWWAQLFRDEHRNFFAGVVSWRAAAVRSTARSAGLLHDYIPSTKSIASRIRY